MNIFKTAFKNEISEIKITSLKEIPTSDGYAYSANILIGRKKVCTISHEGRGGEPSVRYVSKGTEKMMNDYIVSNELKQKMFNSGWNFLDSFDKIHNTDVLDTIISEELNLRDFMKDLQSAITKMVSELEEGEVILNTNLTKLGLTV